MSQVPDKYPSLPIQPFSIQSLLPTPSSAFSETLEEAKENHKPKQFKKMDEETYIMVANKGKPFWTESETVDLTESANPNPSILSHLYQSITAMNKSHQVEGTVLHHFSILHPKWASPLIIQIDKTNNETSITLKASSNLYALLQASLPDLKEHLRKKKLSFKSLDILELEEETQNNLNSKSDDKNTELIL